MWRQEHIVFTYHIVSIQNPKEKPSKQWSQANHHSHQLSPLNCKWRTSALHQHPVRRRSTRRQSRPRLSRPKWYRAWTPHSPPRCRPTLVLFHSQAVWPHNLQPPQPRMLTILPQPTSLLHRIMPYRPHCTKPLSSQPLVWAIRGHSITPRGVLLRFKFLFHFKCRVTFSHRHMVRWPSTLPLSIWRSQQQGTPHQHWAQQPASRSTNCLLVTWVHSRLLEVTAYHQVMVHQTCLPLQVCRDCHLLPSHPCIIGSLPSPTPVAGMHRVITSGHEAGWDSLLGIKWAICTIGMQPGVSNRVPAGALRLPQAETTTAELQTSAPWVSKVSMVQNVSVLLYVLKGNFTWVSKIEMWDSIQELLSWHSTDFLETNQTNKPLLSSEVTCCQVKLPAVKWSYLLSGSSSSSCTIS